MNGHWLRITGIALLALAACGTSKFSSDFASEIQRDCLETVACNPTTSLETCITNTTAKLDSTSVSQQQFFVDSVYRCQATSRCDYVTCTQSTASQGWAAAHNAEITYDCQQRVTCKGTTVSTAVTTCIQETSNLLNADATAQPAFEARWARCGSFAGCSYGACQ